MQQSQKTQEDVISANKLLLFFVGNSWWVDLRNIYTYSAHVCFIMVWEVIKLLKVIVENDQNSEEDLGLLRKISIF